MELSKKKGPACCPNLSPFSLGFDKNEVEPSFALQIDWEIKYHKFFLKAGYGELLDDGLSKKFQQQFLLSLNWSIWLGQLKYNGFKLL